MVSPQHSDVDGKVWTNNQEDHDMYRLDVEDRQVREHRAVQGSGRQADLGLRHADRQVQQRLSARVRRHEHRHARRQDRHGHDLPDADQELAAAARPRRRAEPAVVRRVRRQRHRHVRSEDRDDQGIQAPDASGALPYDVGAEQGRLGGLDRLDARTITWRGSTPRPGRSPSICCRAPPTSAASSCRRRARGRCSGSAATTAPRS